MEFIRIVFLVGYWGTALAALFATMDGIDYWLGVGGFFSFLIAAALSWIPLVGAAFGVAGATQVWGWEMWQAILLFFWPLALWGILALLVAAEDVIAN